LGLVRAIGLMSGTSLDGVDVALIETDGERIAALGPTGYRPYSESERDLLRQALAAGAALSDRWQRPGVLAEADDFVTRVHAEMVETFLATEHIKKSDVGIVGFHGQTVLHRPATRLTVQIGNGEKLAERLKLPVPMTSEPPMLRQAGKALHWCRCSIRRLRVILTGRTRWRC